MGPLSHTHALTNTHFHTHTLSHTFSVTFKFSYCSVTLDTWSDNRLMISILSLTCNAVTFFITLMLMYSIQ